MNPHQRNKIDVSTLSEEEQKLFRLYGKLPNKKDILQQKLKGQERKYFDSGDYALSKAGKAGDAGITQLGREHPSPDNIPHLTPQNSNTGHNGNPPTNAPPAASGVPGLPPQAGSPIKESSFLQSEMNLQEIEQAEPAAVDGQDAAVLDEVDRAAEAVSPPPTTDGMPIRQPQ